MPILILLVSRCDKSNKIYCYECVHNVTVCSFSLLSRCFVSWCDESHKVCNAFYTCVQNVTVMYCTIDLPWLYHVISMISFGCNLDGVVVGDALCVTTLHWQRGWQPIARFEPYNEGDDIEEYVEHVEQFFWGAQNCKWEKSGTSYKWYWSKNLHSS